MKHKSAVDSSPIVPEYMFAPFIARRYNRERPNVNVIDLAIDNISLDDIPNGSQCPCCLRDSKKAYVQQSFSTSPFDKEQNVEVRVSNVPGYACGADCDYTWTSLLGLIHADRAAISVFVNLAGCELITFALTQKLAEEEAFLQDKEIKLET